MRLPSVRALLFLPLLAAASPVAAEEDFWWWIRGFEITPGAGFRHLGFEVVRKSDSYRGNISNDIASSLFAALSIESPSYQFGESNFGVSAYWYTASVRLNEQFVADAGQDSSSASASGSRENVGTGVSGYYSYIVPALHYRARGPAGEGKVALGFGRWKGRFSGDIILTSDNRPATGMPKTPIDVNVSKNAYLALLQFKFANQWQIYMSVGGPKWQDDANRYLLEEVSIVVGYTFRL
jgi:hypothetical protein